MAAQTVTHAQGHLSGDDFHGLHFAVTRLAGNASGNMGPMVEVHMVGKGMNSLPFESFAGVVYGSQLLNFRTVSLGHPVAAHTRLHTRDARHS